MARVPYDITVAGSCHFTRGDGSSPSDALVGAVRFVEELAGVSRRKPQGFIPPTAYSMRHRYVINAQGRCEEKQNIPIFGFIYTGCVGGGVGAAFASSEHFDAAAFESQVDPSLANKALIKARNKVKDTDVNLGVAFAERSATARLVGDTAINLYKSYRHLRRGEVRKAMDALGISSRRREPRGSNAPQKWLELQYGWKPLLSDVYGSCSALSKRKSDDWLVTAKAKASVTGSRTVQFDGLGAGTMVARWEDSVFVRIDALPQDVAKITLVSLGITNPLLIGWELVPFSFVVDWFAPVGGYLESLDALLGYSVFGYSSSQLTRISWDGEGRSTNPFPGLSYVNVYSERKRMTRLVRTVSDNVPFPHFPRFKDPRSLEHMANGLSLLATVFGRK